MIEPHRPAHLVYTHRPSYAFAGRTIDVIVSVIALALTSPLLVLAAIAIKVEDGGPILFCQTRVGMMGALFTVFKLRTMRVSTCVDALSPTDARDRRVTRIGYWLRKTSIDELPQFANVLRGEMSIVGPRPEMPFVVRAYADWQNLRLLAKPGITGLWQVTCRSSVALHEARATALDLEYIRSASQLTDARILLKTFAAIFSTQGAY